LHILQEETHIHKSISLLDNLVNENCLSEDFILVDIGANIGDVSIEFAKKWPGKKVICFEPLHDSFLELKGRIKLLKNISAYELAIGNRKTSGLLHITELRKSSSLLELNIESFNKLTSYLSSILAPSLVEVVAIDTLDNILNQSNSDLIGIMKIDVQGGELMVLRGAVTALERTAIIVIEMSNHDNYLGNAKYFELDEELRNNGFELFDLIPSLWNHNKIYEWNSIYTNNRLVNSL